MPFSLIPCRRGVALVVALAVAFLILTLVGWPAARAAVGLSSFSATPDPAAGIIQVTWATETEVDVAAFRVLRNSTPVSANAQQVDQQPARGAAVTGAGYDFADSTVSPGTTYYYWLYELTVDGQLNLLRTSLMAEDYITAALPASTTPPATPPATSSATNTPTTLPATNTPTATPPGTNTPVATSPVGVTSTPTSAALFGLTPTVPQPGSAPSLQSTPLSATPATGSQVAPPDSAFAQQPLSPLATPVATLAIASPQGSQPLPGDPGATAQGGTTPGGVPASAAGAPGTTPMAARPPAQAPQPTVGIDQPSALLQARPTATPRPGPPAADRGNTTSLVAIVGGGTLCGASLLALAALVIWRRS